MIPAATLACALLHQPPGCALPGDSAVIMPAVDRATTDDRLRAVLVVYGWLESRWRMHPRAESWDARAGRARGPWQLWAGGDASIDAQARLWLHNVQASSLASVDSSVRRAWRRASLAQGLVTEAAAGQPR